MCVHSPTPALTLAPPPPPHLSPPSPHLPMTARHLRFEGTSSQASPRGRRCGSYPRATPTASGRRAHPLHPALESPLRADGVLRRQAYTPEHQVIKVGLDKLVHRISQTGQCICTYANENDVCRCAAKFSINEEDRALAADELQRRHNVTKRRGQKRARAQ